MRFSREKRAFILFLTFFLLSVFIITVDYHGNGFFGLMEDAGMVIIKPINQSSQSVIRRISGFFNMFSETERIRQQNNQLRIESQTLAQENAILREKLAAYERMEKMLQFKEYYFYDMIGAQVIGRDPSNWFHSIMIDRGSADQVEVDMGVATYNGLVGKIIQVHPNSSQVVLLLDQGCSVGAMDQRSREIGVVRGGMEDNYCYFDYIAHDADIEINDIVTTSGIGSSIPKGIQVGRIVAIKKEKHDLFQRILVKPEVDFNKLEEVFVVKQIQE